MPEAPAAPPAAPSAPPAAPPSAPAAPASPTPPAAPAAAPGGDRPPTPARWEADLDTIEQGGTPARPGAEPIKPGEPPPAKPATPPATPPGPARSDIPKFEKIGEFRKWAEGRHEAAKQLEAEKQQLQTRLSQLEQVAPKTQQESTILTGKISTLEKQIGQYEQLLATHVYEQSPEYKKDYAQPFYDAMQRVERKMAEFTVKVPTGEKDGNDQEIVRERDATGADFQYIYKLPPRQARSEARRLFGSDAEAVLQMRETVGELAEKAVTALEQHKQTYQEKLKQSEASRLTERSQSDQFWRKANDAISADPKFSLYWGEEKEDVEANKALTSGFTLADYFFSEERDKLPAQDRIAFDANVRHRIAGFSKLRYLVGKLKADLDARENEIATLRGSRPGPPSPTGGSEPSKRKTIDEAIDELPS